MPKKTRVQYLAELREIARSRRGKVLSRAYVDDTTKLRFRCAEGHEWTAAPGKIKQGRWCPTCGRLRTVAPRKAKAYARLRRIVERRDGTILSPTYVNSQTKMRLRCAERHEWEAVPNSILLGMWCRKCATVLRQAKRKDGVLRRLRRRAKKHGGEILSETFEGAHVPFLVRCREGHEWRTVLQSIDQGVWCRTCKEESWLELVRRRAEERGGECLSRRCRDAADVVQLVCSQGHRFKQPATQVKSGTWCPKCHLALPYGIERMREVARERGGECLSKRYVDSASNLLWRCAEGHEWRADPQSIVNGTWCGVCNRGYGKSRRQLSIEIMHDMARERGGACLSKLYTNLEGRLRWRCARGHEWVTVANNVRRGCWCPKCSHSILGTLERLKAFATERSGRCLTRRWNDHSRPLLFACGAGHRFRLRSNVVKSGVWCPECPTRSRSREKSVGRKR